MLVLDIKNQEKILKFVIFSVIFVSALGTLLHFIFEWSNGNLFVGVFSAVNESTWEHLKLLFYPMFLSSILGYFYLGKAVSSYWCARLFGIIFAMLFTVIFFYTYTGIIGMNIDFFNISIFFIAVIIGKYISYRIMLSNISCDNSKAIISLLLLLFCFIFFTYFPPRIGLFEDPITNTYGIPISN